MKRLAIFYAIMLFAMSAWSQHECKDVIYSQDGDKILFNCCILEVRNVNNVIYIKEGDTLSTPAYAIHKDGEYFELVKNPHKPVEQKISDPGDPEMYRGHNYAYYQRLFYGSKKRQGVGVFLTVLGVGLEIGGFVIASNEYATDNELVTAGNLLLIGSLMETVGIPLWISGAVRKGNNRKAMQEIERQRGLTIGVNKSGFGLAYRF